ncbi:protein PLASTID MOVEMENT IMPAIRED 2 isoform X2 [Herrania umbratica]|uniref:Protein PLASTID MOVEMENT IMPAIRED 2 isoform X2 n=1 Tax=Herrania umbratica TaxID=108875 RepID=A0A6J1BET8_9ROSI|nr:protein PLASTID MOVEMENT IMPAIRED 2 isoform X2 [Herrania umbratica]
MDRRTYEDRRRNGTVKAAVNIYGERILDGNFSLKKPQEDFPEPSSRARELHMARRDMSRYKESRRAAESAKFKAESELFSARETVKDLASIIEESNFKAKAKMRDIESLRKSGNREEKALVVRSIESYQYAEVMKELELVKQELSKLKLDMASVREEKGRAEKEFGDSSLKMWSNASSVEALRTQIEAANEEHVLVELARIEALKEVGEIEAQREKEAGGFSFSMEETKEKMKEIIEEIDQSKELEKKLAVTLSDVNLLENKLKQVKKLDKRVQRSDDLKQPEHSFRSAAEVEGSPSLQSITKELEVAKKELASIREEGFQYMSSMDIIRNELKHVKEETARSKKTGEKADLKVQSLNSKLLRAKSKLEAVTAAGEKAESIVTNLSLTLEQLKTEAEAARKEKALITEDTATIKAQIQKTESEIDFTEERLKAAVQELKAVKASEASSLEKLRSLIETTMQSRASASNQSSTITISKFEYEYLTGRAVGAEEIADKKVAATQAWIEALKASEREILMKTEIAHRDLREMRVEEEHEVHRTAWSLSAKKMIETELRNRRQTREKNAAAQNKQSPFRRRSMKSNGNLTPSGQARFRKSASPVIRAGGSTPFIIKKKRKVMPNLAKFFRVSFQKENVYFKHHSSHEMSTQQTAKTLQRNVCMITDASFIEIYIQPGGTPSQMKVACTIMSMKEASLKFSSQYIQTQI